MTNCAYNLKTTRIVFQYKGRNFSSGSKKNKNGNRLNELPINLCNSFRLIGLFCILLLLLLIVFLQYNCRIKTNKCENT